MRWAHAMAIAGTAAGFACTPSPHVVLVVEDPANVAAGSTHLSVRREGRTRLHRAPRPAQPFPYRIVLARGRGGPALRGCR